MNGQEQTLSVSALSPETLRAAKEDSEILEQYLKDHESASLRLSGDVDKEITLPDTILRLVYEALAGVAPGKKLKLIEVNDEGSPDFEHQLKQRIKKKEALQRMVEVSEKMRLYDE
jgi:hypothetical protein